MNFQIQYRTQEYEEVDSHGAVFDLLKGKDPADYMFQIKQDGIWGLCVLENGKYTIYSKTGQKKYEGLCDGDFFSLGPTVLIGEFMFGSQRSKDPKLSGRFYVFDCVYTEGRDCSQMPYATRYKLAHSYADRLVHQRFEVCRCYSMSKFGEFVMIMQDQIEGFIVRNWRDKYIARLIKFKFEVEDDFVVIGMNPGLGKHDGRLGALRVGQYDQNHRLAYVQDVGGGFTDKQRDDWWQLRGEYDSPTHCPQRVILVRGKGRFDSGALRNPEFIQLRDDKLPTDCILKRTSR